MIRNSTQSSMFLANSVLQMTIYSDETIVQIMKLNTENNQEIASHDKKIKYCCLECRVVV